MLIYHVNGDWAPGGWLGVDLFFVLSGYLITSLLLSEQLRWGSIDLIGFWLSRARRLLPSLVVVCGAVLVAASLWTVPGRRSPVGWDVLSALLYVANWRFLLGDESYFGNLALPSPVRHTWSLSIEEQYYLLFPLLLIGLSAITRNRIVRSAVLLLLALASAAWMVHLYVPGQDPGRVYYGTDTRAFELLVGAAVGSLMAGRAATARRRRSTVDRVIGLAAWPALAVFAVAFFVLPEKSDLPFQGGLLVLALLATLPILAAAGRTPGSLQSVLSLEWLRRLGLISYSLYLWHWPVIVFLNPAQVPIDGAALSLVQIAVSVGLAVITYRYVERPIRTRGFRALIPARPQPSVAVARVAMPVAVLGALALTQSSGSSAAPASAVGGSSHLEPTAGVSATSGVKRSVVLLGNSVPASLTQNHGGDTTVPDVVPTGNVSLGCDPFPGEKLIDGDPVKVSPDCVEWQQEWGKAMRLVSPDVALYFVPQTLVSDFKNDEGVQRFGTAGHDAFIRSSLDHVRTTSLAHGAKRFALTNLACHRMPDFGVNKEIDLINDDERVRHVNAVATAWARTHGVPVIDTFSALCKDGYHGEVNGVPLYQDGIHYTPRSGPIYWRWLAPQIRDIASGKKPASDAGTISR
ncbi:hypothetical protein VV01_09080 [Luteipulveratus halotolerans]|uniref:Acyltransferase 3 domain-containing protein n=1 Tax=Luteipulveratus halotolerans TaxID=1631356 RepID=A0A0L6CHI1_9MICO|nr:hypothetical protein VV01_09080 [Luteipulveratus halotolerans]